MVMRFGALLSALIWGIFTGGAFVAVIHTLGIIPRLTNLCGNDRIIFCFACMTAISAAVCSFFSLTSHTAALPGWFGCGAALAAGVFVGMVAAALEETLTFLPAMLSHYRLLRTLPALLLAMILGKTVFSALIFCFE